MCDEVSYPTLTEFLESNLRNSHIVFRSSTGIELISYVRQGRRLVAGTVYEKVLQRASTCYKDPELNVRLLETNQHTLRTGAYRELDAYMSLVGKEHEFNVLFVESVLNPVLINILPRYGYMELKTVPPSFWKKL